MFNRKEWNKQYREAHPEQIQRTNKQWWSRNRANKYRKRLANRRHAIEYLGGQCIDCGIDDERVLQFDHVYGGKHYAVATRMGCDWKILCVEVDKCELVCANCHVIRTRERGQYG